MPVLRHVEGHSGTGGVVRYLTKEGRARAFASHGLELEGDWREWDMRAWDEVARQMDATRRELGRDADLNKDGNPNLKFMHYIISPDPADRLKPEQVLELAQAWATRYLSHYQWAVVVHDDGKVAASRGELGPVHAHIVVNGVDLETGGTLAHYLDSKRGARMWEGLQAMAEKRGWRRFEAAEHDAASELEDEARDDRRARLEASRGARVSRADAGRDSRDTPDLAEAGMARDGRPCWKDDMRARLLLAQQLCHTTEQYVEMLDRMGVEVAKAEVADPEHDDRPEWGGVGWRAVGVPVVKGARARGALYVSKADPKLRCYGATFGGRYSDAGLRVGLAEREWRGAGAARVRERAAELAGAVCGPAAPGAPAQAPAPAQVVGAWSCATASELTARQVADALALADRLGGRGGMDAVRRESAEAALVLGTIGYRFPKPAAPPGSAAGARGRGGADAPRRHSSSGASPAGGRSQSRGGKWDGGRSRGAGYDPGLGGGSRSAGRGWR